MSAPAHTRSRRRAGGRSPLRVDADHGALVAAGRRLVIGAILGVIVSVGGGEVFKATTLLYLGQPFTTSGGGQIQSLATNPKTVNRIITLGGGVEAAAGVSGLTVGQLRGNVSSAAIVTAGQGKNVSPLVEITVKAPTGQQAALASNSLANSVVGVVSVYVDQKIKLLNEQIVASKTELKAIDARVSAAVKQQQSILADKSLSSIEKLTAVSISNNTISFSEQRRGTVQQELYQNQQLLSLAENVEVSKIVQPGVAAQDDGDEPPQRGRDRRADRPPARRARGGDRRPLPAEKERAEQGVGWGDGRGQARRRRRSRVRGGASRCRDAARDPRLRRPDLRRRRRLARTGPRGGPRRR